MWSREGRAALGRVLGLAVVLAAGGLTAGCFQPLYGERSAFAGADLRGQLASIDVSQIPAVQGTPEGRIAVEIRNALLFELTGGAGGISPAYRLAIRMTASKSALIVDIATGRTEDEVTGLDCTYTLTELSTGKVVVNGTTFSRVSSDVPGQQQRFARARAQRDAEDRAAKVLADQIRNRLASYMVART